MKTTNHITRSTYSSKSHSHASTVSRVALALTLTAAFLCSLALPALAKTRVSGPPLVQISAGTTEVWGLDAAGNAYQYFGGIFNFIGAAYKQVAVGQGSDVWALGLKGHAFHWKGTTFSEVSPALEFTQIATGGGGTWAITSGGDVYYFNSALIQFERFTKGPPPLAQSIFVGAAPQAVWILDFAAQPHLYNTRTGFFDLVPGVDLLQIAVGDSETWGLDFSGQPRLYHSSPPFAFNVVPSVPLAKITLTTDAELWAVSEVDHAVYHYNPTPKTFDLVDDTQVYEQITAGNSTIGVWALTSTHEIYKF
ncbi:MAG: tectonin domain-containing protein [Candidatus Sulfotelmatobacter sp.]